MTFKQIIDKSASGNGGGQDYLKDINALGVYLKDSKIDSNVLDLNSWYTRDLVALFTEGYFDLKVTHYPCKLAIHGTDKLRTELTIYTTCGAKHLKSEGVLGYALANDNSAPDFLKLQREYKKTNIITHEYLSSGYVEITEGKASINPEKQIRLDRYIRDAERHCKGILAAEWYLAHVHMNKGVIVSMEFYADGTSYYLNLFEPNGNNRWQSTGTRTCQTAMSAMPDKFFPVLRKAIPAGLEMLFPAAILKGFSALRDLLSEDTKEGK